MQTHINQSYQSSHHPLSGPHNHSCEPFGLCPLSLHLSRPFFIHPSIEKIIFNLLPNPAFLSNSIQTSFHPLILLFSPLLSNPAPYPSSTRTSIHPLILLSLSLPLRTLPRKGGAPVNAPTYYTPVPSGGLLVNSTRPTRPSFEPALLNKTRSGRLALICLTTYSPSPSPSPTSELDKSTDFVLPSPVRRQKVHIPNLFSFDAICFGVPCVRLRWAHLPTRPLSQTCIRCQTSMRSQPWCLEPLHNSGFNLRTLFRSTPLRASLRWAHLPTCPLPSPPLPDLHPLPKRRCGRTLDGVLCLRFRRQGSSSNTFSFDAIFFWRPYVRLRWARPTHLPLPLPGLARFDSSR